MPGGPLPAEVDDNLLVLELRAQWVIPGRAAGESRWRFVQLKSGLLDQRLALADAWQLHLQEWFVISHGGGWRLDQLIVRDLWPATLPDLIVPVGFVDPGSPSEQGPPQAAPIITWRTDFIGRSYRGRTYWPPTDWGDLDNGTTLGTVRGWMNQFALAMMTYFSGAGLSAIDPHFIIFSRQHDGVPEPKGRYAPVTAYTVRPYLATQRRRQRYYNPP